MAKKSPLQNKSKKNAEPAPKKGSAIKRNPILISEKWQIIGLVLFTIIIYMQSLSNDFVNFDDLKHIVTNEIIQHLTVENVVTMFTEPINLAYRPLSFLSFTILYRFFGADPFYFHLLNLLFHLLNTLLIYRFSKIWIQDHQGAFIIAALFALHPLHVESVAWVSALNDTLYGCFSLLALINYSLYITDNQRLKYFILSTLFLILALLSKPLAVVLPIVFWLLDWYSRRSIFTPRTILEKIPLLGISIFIAYISVWARNDSVNEMENITTLYTFGDRLFFAFYSIQFYLLKFFLPIGLSAFHAFPLKTGGSLPTEFYAAPLTFLALIVIVFFAKKLRRTLLFGLLFFLFNIALVLQIIPFGETVVAERYTYLSYWGLFFIVAQIFVLIKKGELDFGANGVLFFWYISIFVTLIFAIISYQRTQIWKNGVTMFRNAYEQYPYNLSVLSGLGHAYIKYDENFGSAISVFDELVTLYPDYVQGYHSRGSAKLEANDWAGAIEDFNTVLAQSPENIATLHNRSEANLKAENYAAVLEDCRKILQLDPNYAPSVAQMGHAYFNLNNYPEAIAQYNRHLQLVPTDGNTFFFRGVAHYNSGNGAQACNDWKQAVSLGYTDAGSMLQKYCNGE